MDLLEFLEKEIENIKLSPQKQAIGKIVEVKDEVCRIEGLYSAESMEVLKIEGEKEAFALALTLEEDSIGALLLGKTENIKEGMLVRKTNQILSCPVGPEFIGRVINPLGQPIDGRGEIKSEKFYPLERIAPSVVDREPVNFPLHTGIKVIDGLIPIGRGQRELILGDRICDKTGLALATIFQQKDEPKRPICIYSSIGQRASLLARMIEKIREFKADEYTIVVASVASDPISFWYLAPYTACALGEYFMHQGMDAVVIYDSLEKHAYAWRQISLVLRKPPGREAYPGDIFYLHSRLLERAAKLNEKNGGGSLTALPIYQTLAGDITAYIPTNLISICDGQIILDTSLLFRGQRPEVNIGLSVSRVGSAAQTRAMKKVAGELKLKIAQFQELERFLEFAEELDPETRKKLEHGKRLREILKQERFKILPFEKQVLIFWCATKGYLDEIPLERIREFERELLEFFEFEGAELLKKIKETKELDQNTELEIERLVKPLVRKYVAEGT